MARRRRHCSGWRGSDAAAETYFVFGSAQIRAENCVVLGTPRSQVWAPRGRRPRALIASIRLFSHVSPTVVKVLHKCPAWLTPRQRFLVHKFLEGTGFVHESIGKGRRRRLVIGRGSAATTLPPNSRALPRSAISTNVCNGIERALGFTNKVSTLLHSNSRNDDLKLSAWRSPQYHIIHDTTILHNTCMIYDRIALASGRFPTTTSG